jgi:hypothetical protein
MTGFAAGFGAGSTTGFVGAAAATGFLADALAIPFLAARLRAGDLAALTFSAGALAGAGFAAGLLADFFAADFFVVFFAGATFFFPIVAFFAFFAMIVSRSLRLTFRCSLGNQTGLTRHIGWLAGHASASRRLGRHRSGACPSCFEMLPAGLNSSSNERYRSAIRQ